MKRVNKISRDERIRKVYVLLLAAGEMPMEKQLAGYFGVNRYIIHRAITSFRAKAMNLTEKCFIDHEKIYREIMAQPDDD